MMNKSNSYFKRGDVVRYKDVWGGKLFIVNSFSGNEYLPLMHVHPMSQVNKRLCNFDERKVELISFSPRPLKKIDKRVLVKLMSKGNIDARREFLVRRNCKVF